MWVPHFSPRGAALTSFFLFYLDHLIVQMNSKYYLILKKTFLYLEGDWEEKNNRNFQRFNRDFLCKNIVSFGDKIAITSDDFCAILMTWEVYRNEHFYLSSKKRWTKQFYCVLPNITLAYSFFFNLFLMKYSYLIKMFSKDN